VSVFGENYASYYDLFYADKDYAGEAAFVRDVIERHRPSARTATFSAGHNFQLEKECCASDVLHESLCLRSKRLDQEVSSGWIKEPPYDADVEDTRP
jgi:hypothetical protein